MKYFEYGVVTYGSDREDTNVFRKNSPKDQIRDVMSQLSDKGNLGWEIFHVLESPDGKTHFLMKREISKEYAKEMYQTKYKQKYSEDGYSLGTEIKKQGFVDSVGPDSETWK